MQAKGMLPSNVQAIDAEGSKIWRRKSAEEDEKGKSRISENHLGNICHLQGFWYLL